MRIWNEGFCNFAGEKGGEKYISYGL